MASSPKQHLSPLTSPVKPRPSDSFATAVVAGALKVLLENELVLSAEHCKRLLEDEEDKEVQDLFAEDVDLSPALAIAEAAENDKIPQRPYFRQVAKRIVQWGRKGKFPVQLTVVSGFEHSVNNKLFETIKSKTKDVVELGTNWSSQSDQLDEQVALLLSGDAERANACDLGRLRLLCESLGVRGFLTLLNMQCTIGSIDKFPPPISTLVNAFNESNNKNAKGVGLSVGARALSKHYHRSQHRWWGELKGNDAVKNKKSNELLGKLFRDAVWLNLHQLPHNVEIFEIRVEEGYGARWTGDGLSFRGFLEPQMADGHEKGWKH